MLKTFLAVARHRNITRAAREVHLAQSSVSDQIQSLESELGIVLFIRSRHGLDLTTAGDALKPYAEEILQLAEEARIAAEATTGMTAGTVTVGALETIATVKLPQWLAAFRGDHPEIGLRLKIAGSDALLRQLEESEIDVAFCFDKGGLDERLARRTISAEPLVLVASPEHAPASGQSDLAALAAMRFVVTETGCVYRHLFDTAFAEMAAPETCRRSRQHRRHCGPGGDWCRHGPGAAAGRCRRARSRRDRRIAVAGPARTASLVMIWRRRRVQPPALKLLLAAAARNFAALRSAGDRPRHAEPSLS
ncbi:LysR family transcriptional regulator [Mesorhizobium sp. L103C105A0]|nr:LysR family transcriptional regulator [Mesorhizobium sp. L103C105A0]